MSHIVTIQTKVHDPAAVAAACQRIGLAPAQQGTARLYSGEAKGLLVQLPGWQSTIDRPPHRNPQATLAMRVGRMLSGQANLLLPQQETGPAQPTF